MNKHNTNPNYINSTVSLFSIMTLLLITLFVIPITQATTIEAVSIEEAMQGSELVIEGRVINSEARKPDNSRMIHTYVTVEILDVIKGSYSDKTVELSFLGGKLGDRVMEVGEMDYPELGEQGIYFIESLQRTQANSLFGWSQGHFLIRNDADGTPRVTTKKNTPVTGMDKNGSKQQAAQATSSQDANHESGQEFSHGEAKGLLLEKAAPISRAMTPQEFKQELSKMSVTGQGEE